MQPMQPEAPQDADPQLAKNIPVSAGLCAHCQHARAVVSARASIFVLCSEYQNNPALVKYPGIPVLRCPGFTQI